MSINGIFQDLKSKSEPEPEPKPEPEPEPKPEPKPEPEPKIYISKIHHQLPYNYQMSNI